MTCSEKLKNITLAPWIFKGTALSAKPRIIGGNQFRHNMATMCILIDYEIIDSVLLKAAVIHDLLEEIPETDISDLLQIDDESEDVIKLVKEVTKNLDETKADYLTRILIYGSFEAKLLKCADRISNITDLHPGTFINEKILNYLAETEEYILPLCRDVNDKMYLELCDLVKKRRSIININY